MQRESAVEAMRVVRVCIAELEQAIQFAREYEKDPKELRNFAGMIAPVMDAIFVRIINRVVSEYPDLKPPELK